MAQKGKNSKEQDQMCKTNRLVSTKKIPPKSAKDEVQIKGKVGHMPRNIKINAQGSASYERDLVDSLMQIGPSGFGSRKLSQNLEAITC